MGLIQPKIGLKHPWVKGIQVSGKKNFSRTTGQVLTKHGTKHSFVKENQVFNKKRDMLSSKRKQVGVFFYSINMMEQSNLSFEKMYLLTGTVSRVSDLAHGPFISVQFALFCRLLNIFYKLLRIFLRFALENMGENSVPNHI